MTFSSPATIKLTLPLPPSVNNQYVTIGHKRVLSKTAKAFNRDVIKIVSQARLHNQIEPAIETALKGALLGIYLTFYFETPFRRDLDGGLKIALDALCRALDLDDRMVVDLHLTKRIEPLSPHLDVEIEGIDDWSFDRSYVFLGTPTGENEPPQ